MITLAALLEKPGLGACLDDLLASRFLPRRDAARIRTIPELPSALRDCAANLVAESAWRAHGDAERILFAVAVPHAEPEAEVAGGLAIDVYFLDEKAAVYCAGVWAYDLAHGWWLDAVLDLSYDCERGWWIDALMAKPAPADEVFLALPPASSASPPAAGALPLIAFRQPR